jgi:hypothetical protein
MEKLEVSRNGDTDQFSIVLSQGNDSIRCMITVDSGHGPDISSDDTKYRAALLKAKALAKALHQAIDHRFSQK